MTALAARPEDTPRALATAGAIVAAWAAHLAWRLSTPLDATPWWSAALGVALQTWLFTGLFITAHDAMHGTVAPGRPRLNRAVGRLAAALYAAFPYDALEREHRRHHAAPGTADDPDFHDGAHRGFVRWYLRFMLHYVRWTQIVAQALLFCALERVAPTLNVQVFWVAPALLSTVQLFTFGTWLPHREGDAPWPDGHRARTSRYGALASLLTCFHFGYHWEHHAHPATPWWRLPRALKNRG